MTGFLIALALAAPLQQRPRILTFEARPDSIKPGESILLVWDTDTFSGVTIEPEIGAVSPRGIRQLTPEQTTTYTLRVRGGPAKTITVIVEGSEAAAANAAEARPDFSGVYSSVGLPSDALMPVLMQGAEKYRVKPNAANECKPRGVPQVYADSRPFQIIQTPKFIMQIFGYPNPVRTIPIDGRARADNPPPTWMGSSSSRWEGKTLVVDTIGFNDKTEVHGFMHTTALHVVERFTRLESGDLQYEVTIEDPNVFSKPWVLPARTFSQRPELDSVDESIC